jgi:nucleotidyltransferase/DNA polymerase involved in DNA repair
MGNVVLHVDLDQFIAAVELLRRPELRGKPVVVGGDGDPTKRGVVSTANYEARAYGVGSGMPLRTAYKRCPEAVFLAVDADAYLAASREVMATLRSFPAVVEVTGWDEAFMAVEADDPEALARQVQRGVLERTRLWSSIGVGDNKLRAKLATGFAKPAGVFSLTRENWAAVMDGRPTDALWGIGAKTAPKLAALGIHTVRQLATADEDLLARTFGPTIGPWLRHLATGEDASRVTDEPYVPKGRGRERTFQENIGDPAQVRAQVARLARELAAELAGGARPAVRIVVKVRFAPFFTHTHGAALPEPTLDPGQIVEGAMAALDRFTLDRPVRLVGVRADLIAPEADAGAPEAGAGQPEAGTGDPNADAASGTAPST